MSAAASPVRVLEAAYRVDGTATEWLDGIAQSVTDALAARKSLGAVAHVATARVVGAHRLPDQLEACSNSQLLALEPAVCFEMMKRHVPPPMQEALFFSQKVASTGSKETGLGADLESHPFWPVLWKPGPKDALGVVGHDGALREVVVSTALARPYTLGDREQHLWQRIAVHLGTALRLRRDKPVPDRAAAVLAADGTFSHLETRHERARQSLADGFARRRHALGAQDPEHALDVWRGLVDGRWSLVDYLDTDGKAFVLAVRNQPAQSIISKLTGRQRAVVALASLGYGNKRIAYALGLTEVAVAMQLTRAKAATGTRSRVELVKGFKRELERAE